MAETTWDVNIDTAVIKNVRSTGYNLDAQIIADRASGSLGPSALFIGNMDPRVSLQSSDIATLVALNSATFVSNGLCITSASTIVPFARRADCAVVASGGSHTTLTCNNTIIIPQSFEARQESADGAICSLECRFRSSDGVTNPVTVSTTATLSASTYGATFGLGKATVNASAVAGLVGVMINPNITITPQRKDGGPYPVTHYLISTNPTIDLMVEDLKAAAAYLPSGGSGIAVEAYFRKRKDGAIFEPDASLVHVKFSFASSLVNTEMLEANQSGNGSATIRCHGKVLVAAADVAIP